MVGFEQNSYSVTEGQPMVLICTEISGDQQRAVVVNLTTEEGTAQCELGSIRFPSCCHILKHCYHTLKQILCI